MFNVLSYVSSRFRPPFHAASSPRSFVARETSATREKDDQPRDTFAIPVPFRFLKSRVSQEFRNQPPNLRWLKTERVLRDDERNRRGGKEKKREEELERSRFNTAV